jgi:tetratricopeptide (TPR) repeat protein
MFNGIKNLFKHDPQVTVIERARAVCYALISEGNLIVEDIIESSKIYFEVPPTSKFFLGNEVGIIMCLISTKEAYERLFKDQREGELFITTLWDVFRNNLKIYWEDFDLYVKLGEEYKNRDDMYMSFFAGRIIAFLKKDENFTKNDINCFLQYSGTPEAILYTQIYKDIFKMTKTVLNLLATEKADKKKVKMMSMKLAEYFEDFNKSGNKYETDIRIFKQVVNENPGSVEAHFELASAYYEAGMYKDAIDNLQKTISLSPNYAEAYVNLGLALYRLELYHESIEAFKKAIEIRPSFFEAYNGLGMTYVELEMYGEAVKNFKKTIELRPDNIEAHHKLGTAYLCSGKFQDAIELYEQALRIQPDYAHAHYNLGLALLLTGQENKAIEEYNILKHLSPELAEQLNAEIIKQR